MSRNDIAKYGPHLALRYSLFWSEWANGVAVTQERYDGYRFNNVYDNNPPVTEFNALKPAVYQQYITVSTPLLDSLRVPLDLTIVLKEAPDTRNRFWATSQQATDAILCPINEITRLLNTFSI
jgi:hypothetical protein